jgi:hypothetical protein
MWSLGVGGLLTALGIGLLFWFLGGAMAPTAGPGSAVPSSQWRPILAVVAGLSLAGGLSILGLAVGRWRRPERPGSESSRTPDQRGESRT